MKQTALVTVADLGPGLEKSPVTDLVQVALSQKPGQALALDEDNRLYAPQGEGWPVVTEDPAAAPFGVPWLLSKEVSPGAPIGVLLAGFGADILCEPITPLAGYALSVNTPAGIARTTMILESTT